jgi:hypothetical protein
MRLSATLLPAAALLCAAGCSKPDPVANNLVTPVNLPATANGAAPTPLGGPPANASESGASPPSTPKPSAAAVIPPALQGRWGLAPADCTSALGDAKGLLVINSGELRFYESRAVPSPGVQSDRDSMTGNFRFTGEGQNWTKFESIERNGDRLTRTESNPAASYTYAKC